MGLTIKNEGKARELINEGTYLAVCVGILDLGTQTHEKFGDKRKINVAFEVLNEQTEEGEPFVLYKKYSASLANRSRLGTDLKSWLGLKFERDGEFDLDQILGKPGMITVVHSEGTDGKVYANIEAITGILKGTKVPKPTTPLKSLYLDETFDEEEFNALPEFLQEQIAQSPEYQAIKETKRKKPAPAPKAAAKKGKR